MFDLHKNFITHKNRLHNTCHWHSDFWVPPLQFGCVCLEHDPWCLKEIMNILQSVDYKTRVKLWSSVSQNDFHHLTQRTTKFDTKNERLKSCVSSPRFTGLYFYAKRSLAVTTSTTSRSQEGSDTRARGTDIKVVNGLEGLTTTLDSG